MEAFFSLVLLFCGSYTLLWLQRPRVHLRLPLAVFSVGIALFSLSFMFATKANNLFMALWLLLVCFIALYQFARWRYTFK